MAKIREIYDNTIKDNGNRQVIYPITRAQAVYTDTNQKIQDLLNEGYRFGGLAKPSGVPSVKQRIFYVAATPGYYPNYGGLTIDGGESAFLLCDGTTWEKVAFSGTGNKNLTGYKTLANISLLPDEESTLGYLIDNNLYVWVGEGGDTAGGKYENCGHLDGASAYEVAVQEGFSGTEEEWLESLVGPTGKSAYQSAVDNGFEGTEAEWVYLMTKASRDMTIVETELEDVVHHVDSGSLEDLEDPSAYATRDEYNELRTKIDGMSTGKYYGFHVSEEDLPEATDPGYAYIGESAPYALWNFDGLEWKDSGVTVDNAPVGNEEDIDQDDAGLLKLADRPTSSNQMGYVILRKNKTFAEQVTLENTIYEIRYAFDLDSASVTIPAGCVLKFDGGSLSNGTLSGNDTRIDYTGTIFGGITISGTWIVPEIRSSMFANLSNNGLKNLFALQSENIHNTIYVAPGNYTVGFSTTVGGSTALIITADTDCIIDGIISLDDEERSTQMLSMGYRIIGIYGDGSSLRGNGELIGDIDDNGNNTQSGHGVYIYQKTNVELSGLKISNCAGDGIVIGPGCGDVYIHDIEITNWNRNGISVIECSNATIENIYAHDGGFVDPWAAIDVEPNSGNHVGSVKISGFKAINTGVGLQCISHAGKIDSFVADNVVISGCKKQALISIGDYGVTNSKYSNITIANFPSEHDYSIASIIRMINYGAIKFDKLSLDVTDIVTKDSYGCMFNGGRVSFEQCKFIGDKIFTYHINNVSFRECEFDGTNIFWSSSTAPMSYSSFSLCKFRTTRLQLAMDYSAIRDCFFDIIGFVSDYGTISINTTTDKGNVLLKNNHFVVSSEGTSVSTYYILSVSQSNVYVIENIFDNKGGIAGGGIISGGENNTFLRNKFLNFSASARKLFCQNQKYSGESEVFPNAGATSDRPTLQATFYDSVSRGTRFFDTTLSRPSWHNGSKWVDSDGYKPMKKHGATTDRPIPGAEDIGFTFFDESLGKMIVWNGTAWVNMDGSTLS